MKKFLIISAILGLVLMPAIALAASFRVGETSYVNKDEVVDDDLYAFAGTLNIDGKVNGDLVAMARTVNISGEITGDLIVAGGTISIKGKVGEAVRMAGGALTVDGEIGDDLIIGGGTVVISKTSKINGDLLIGSGTLNMDGQVSGYTRLGTSNATISGQIGKDLVVYMGEDGILNLTSTAIVNGNLTYYAKKDASIDKGTKISGEVIKREPMTYEEARANKKALLIFTFISYLATLIVSLLLIKLFRGAVEKVSTQLEKHPWKSLLWGFVILILVPVAFVVLLITILGSHLGLILLGLYFLALYISKIFVSIFVGSKLLDYMGKKVNLYWSAILGLAFYSFLGLIPYVGLFVKLAVLLLGLGAFYLNLKENLT